MPFLRFRKNRLFSSREPSGENWAKAQSVREGNSVATSFLCLCFQFHSLFIDRSSLVCSNNSSWPLVFFSSLNLILGIFFLFQKLTRGIKGRSVHMCQSNIKINNKNKSVLFCPWLLCCCCFLEPWPWEGFAFWTWCCLYVLAPSISYFSCVCDKISNKGTFRKEGFTLAQIRCYNPPWALGGGQGAREALVTLCP